MRQYIDILQTILEQGVKKTPVRIIDGVATPVDGGVKTLYYFAYPFRHDMSEGFPLLTIRPMPWKSIRVELEGFIKGITSKRWYKDRSCHYWDSWCNPKAVEYASAPLIIVNENEKDNLPWRVTQKEYNQIIRTEKEKVDDLGPIYGYQWRKFGEAYDEDDSGSLKGYDQLVDIVYTLHTNYNDRRMVCSAWNPNQKNRMALEPCHWGWNVSCGGGKLNLAWIQRSVDTLRGLPSNIASYGLLLLLLAKEAKLEPGNLSAILVDCHLYEDQIEAAKELVKREPLSLSSVSIPDILKSGKPYSIFDWTYEDIYMSNRNVRADKIENMGKLVV